MAQADAQLRGVLDGIKVLDLSPDQVGAQTSQLFADYGAEVIWVERPKGSPLRRQACYPFLARGKHSVVLDLSSPDDMGAARQLADGADVLIETFRPGVTERLGLGYDRLRESNPGLVYASISGFGAEGPYATVQGYEGVVAAKLGLNACFSRMHGGPQPPFLATPWCSFAASQTALHGILAALIERECSGFGQRVETNLAQAFACLDTWGWFQHLVGERWPDAFYPVGAFDRDGIPASPLAFMLLVPLTKDGRWLQFAQVAPRLFASFMKALGLDWMLSDPEWKGIPAFDDVERRSRLWTMMLEAAGKKTLAEWQEVFERDGNVFAELFRRGPEVLDHPQLVADGHVVDVGDSRLGQVRQPGPLVDADPPLAGPLRPAPEIGEGNASWRSAATPIPTGEPPRGRLPLEGITILELAVLFAAPYGATLLTDLGARVIKVEPLGGDPIRTIIAFPESGGAKVMQGKESIAVDITTPNGRSVVLALARQADIVLEGFRSGVADRLGIGADALRAINPQLVHLSAYGYGPGAPNGHRPAYAPSIAAAAGVTMANVGDAVPEEAGLGIAAIREASMRLTTASAVVQAQADGFAALGVATSMLLGLLTRARSGLAPRLFNSMLQTAAHAMADQVVGYRDKPPPLSGGPEMRGPQALYRTYDAADGWVFLAAPRQSEWERLVEALRPYVDLSVPEYATPVDRWHHDAALIDALATLFTTRSKDAWEQDLLAADVACVAVSTEPVEAILMSDRIGRASGYLADVNHPVFDGHPRLAPAVRLSRSATQAKGGVLCGSSTDDVLAELGFTDEQRAELRCSKVIS